MIKVTFILLFLFQFDNQTAASMNTKLLEVPKSNFWSALLRFLDFRKAEVRRVSNGIQQGFQQGALFAPDSPDTATTTLVMGLYFSTV